MWTKTPELELVRKLFIIQTVKGNYNFVVNENTENRLPLLDLLLKASEDGKVLSNQDIRQEIDTFMFEVVLFVNFL